MNLRNIGVSYTSFKSSTQIKQGNLIQVTRSHITRGKQCAENTCPVALAVQERFPNARIEVGGDSILVRHSNNSTENYHTPRSVERFINRFDENGRNSVKPFAFKLVRI